MKKLFLIAMVALCTAACNSNADSSSATDSTATGGNDTISTGSSNGEGTSNSGNSTMQGTGSADTGFHGTMADSSRMSATDTSGKPGSSK